MHRLALSLVLALICVCPVAAQITVELQQDENQLLMGEPISLAVRIINRSGQTLKLGDQEGWLTFTVENRDHEKPVPKLAEVPVLGEFELGTAKVATKRVLDLGPYFEFPGPGRYAITATVHIPAWGVEISTDPAVFHINRGTRIWERDVGLPSPSGGPPTVRRYTLQQATNMRKQLVLFLRVSDPTDLSLIKLTPLGPVVSFGRPESQVDDGNRLHVLFQTGPQVFHHCVCNPQGELLSRELYEFSGTRPRLKIDMDGAVDVVGGARRPEPVDITQTSPAVTNAQTSASVPDSTTVPKKGKDKKSKKEVEPKPPA